MLAYMLALRLGRKSGRALLEELSAQEWHEWRAVCKIHPLASDWEPASASTAALIETIKALAPSDGGKNEPMPLDFLVPLRHDDEKETASEIADNLEHWKGLPV